MSWIYSGSEFTEDDIKDSYGFVYCITNRKTGKKYIGKKFFSKAGYKQVNGKRKKIRKSSDWLDYWGSNKKLLEDIKVLGEQHFVRDILHLCKTRSECAYLELKEQIGRRVLESESYYNDWIMVRIRKDHLLKVKEPNGSKTNSKHKQQRNNNQDSFGESLETKN